MHFPSFILPMRFLGNEIYDIQERHACVSRSLYGCHTTLASRIDLVRRHLSVPTSQSDISVVSTIIGVANESHDLSSRILPAYMFGFTFLDS